MVARAVRLALARRGRGRRSRNLRPPAPRSKYWPADIGSANDRGRLLASVVAHFGTLHALVNNAGRAPRVRADLLAATEESFEEVLRTNLQGPYFLTQAVARLFVHNRRQARHAAIVFVTSVSAEMASPQRGEYCVSKAGLSMAAKLFAVRLAADRIPVYEVRPGIIATDMTAGVKEMYDKRIADGLVPGRAMGTARRCGPRGRIALARRHHVRNRNGHSMSTADYPFHGYDKTITNLTLVGRSREARCRGDHPPAGSSRGARRRRCARRGRRASARSDDDRAAGDRADRGDRTHAAVGFSVRRRHRRSMPTPRIAPSTPARSSSSARCSGPR